VHTEREEKNETIVIRIIAAVKQHQPKEKYMKKVNNSSPTDDMLPEYNFEGKKSARGKYFKAMQKGYSVRVLNEDGTVTTQHFVPQESAILLDSDVKAYFPDSKSVNHALRSLIKQTRKQAKATGLKRSDVKPAIMKARGRK
jgi:hypothetical protein